MDIDGTPDGQPSIRASTATPRIAIIGGGVAGLRAASTLSKLFGRTTLAPEEPFITIFEGRDRLGGRLAQTVLPGTNHVVDLGPNWIHGTDRNPILDLAKQLGETTHSFGDEGEADIYDENGNRLERKTAREISEVMWSIVVDAFAKSRKAAEGQGEPPIPEYESLRDFLLEEVRSKFGDEKDPEKKRRLVEQLARMWGAFVGSDYEGQSLKYFWLEECLDGENVFLASTYAKILEWIKSQATLDPNIAIKFSTVVNNITYWKPDQNHGVPMYGSTDEAKSKIQLSITTGEIQTFDHVIITTPLGWLKQNLHIFHPPLPNDMQKSIQELGYGCLEKVFLSYPSAWWNSSTTTGKESHAYATFLSPTYTDTKTSKENPTIIQSISLSNLPDPHSHPTLLFYIFGTHARTLSEDLSFLNDEKKKQAYLVNHFEPYISLLPNYSSSSPACQAISAHFTDWLLDDLAGNGSYSNFQTVAKSDSKALQDLDGSVETLRRGLPESGLWFAGEHTAPFVGLGTVTGAWWSGERVAARLAARCGIEVPPDGES